MRLLCKIYDNERSTTVIAQEFIDSRVDIEQNIQDFWVANFQVPIMTIQEDNKIELYEVWQTDKLVFRGFVYSVEPQRNQRWLLAIQCRSEKALFQKRLFLNDLSSYNVQSVASLPVRPAPVSYDVNYWILWDWDCWFYKWLVQPLSSPWLPPPDPYYDFWTIQFTNSALLANSTDGHIYIYKLWHWLTDMWLWTTFWVNDLLTSMIYDYNKLWEHWSFETDCTFDVDIAMKQWDSYFDVLDQIAQLNNIAWDIIDWVIVFKNLLWNDLTSWDNYSALTYNWLYPNTANINNIKMIWTATRYNIVIWSDWSNNIMVDTSSVETDWKIYWVTHQSWREWALNSNIQAYLSTANILQRLYTVTVEQNSIDVNAGDKIAVIVENTNEYFNINESMIVLQKLSTYDNWSKQVQYIIGNMYVTPVSTSEWLYWLQKKVNFLRLI